MSLKINMSGSTFEDVGQIVDLKLLDKRIGELEAENKELKKSIQKLKEAIRKHRDQDFTFTAKAWQADRELWKILSTFDSEE